MKLCVYAICKNERKFAARWMRSMREADGVFVLDTGSTDGSPELLRQLGAQVTQAAIDPWRFDYARNRSLALVPEDADLCVCTDLDEVFQPGWRAAMEAAFTPGTHQLRYRFTASFQPDGAEGCVFWIAKAHTRRGFRWAHPVHEVLEYTGPAPLRVRDAPGVQLEHHPDEGKSRAQYLPLLELAVRESPDDARDLYYLGREYLFHRRWQDAERVLLRHLAAPGATWREERSAAMRGLSRAVLEQGRTEEARAWLLRAAAEAPHLREPWVESAQLALRENVWSGALYFAETALAIRERSRSYVNSADAWGALPYDLAALSAYYLGLYDRALGYGRAACALSPQDARLRENLRFYEEKAT